MDINIAIYKCQQVMSNKNLHICFYSKLFLAVSLFLAK